jgi:hypothetical protein
MANDFERLPARSPAHRGARRAQVDAPSFPGWDSLGALIQHLKFVRDHHRKIDRVAAVTDNGFLKIVPRIAEHFAHPEIRVFASAERAQALAWLRTRA